MTGLDIPGPVESATLRYGPQVRWWKSYDGTCNLADGFGAVGHGKTWEAALAALELSIDLGRGTLRAIPRGQERRGEWVVGLVLFVVAWLLWKAFDP